MATDSAFLLRRRHFLGLLGAGAAAQAGLPGLAFANSPFADTPHDNRLVMIFLRGAMDGLSAVPPYGDPNYQNLRGKLALAEPGAPQGVLPLDGHFGLHPALAPIHPLFALGELAVVHATAGGYDTRSHFDAQDLLEMGLTQRRGQFSGWLNRTLGDIDHGDAQARLGLAVGGTVPLMLRGPAQVDSWEPPHMRPVDPILIDAMTRLYAHDKLFGAALADAINTDSLSGVDPMVLNPARAQPSIPPAASARPKPKPGQAFMDLMRAAGHLLSTPQGPRIAMADLNGWDTHVAQGAGTGRLAQALTVLANGLDTLRTSLGPAWRNTVVVTVTEFGRTAAPNGTDGTDHGTASATFLLGGAVKGGVHGDFPGLAANALLENRDLRMASDLRGVMKGVLAEHLGVPRGHLDTVIFPDSAAIRPMDGLLKV
ncbi:MAG TPA: DUF1501 domain-containing protein [Stellaceae bacterium]|jgi:uncharacterized protein (DUF1501 family)|nr:DUF1501 domain-containing protein [Stellaceae bacterium]